MHIIKGGYSLACQITYIYNCPEQLSVKFNIYYTDIVVAVGEVENKHFPQST